MEGGGDGRPRGSWGAKEQKQTKETDRERGKEPLTAGRNSERFSARAEC